MSQHLRDVAMAVVTSRICQRCGWVIPYTTEDDVTMAHGDYVKGDVAEWVRTHVGVGSVAIDGGAADGVMTSALLDVVGDTGKVIAVEPRDTAGLDRLKTDPRVTVVQAMLGDTAEDEESFYLHVERPTGSSRYPTHMLGTAQAMRVPQVRLDDLAKTADVVKLDLQGGELCALRGAPRLLRTCRHWVIEMWPWGLQPDGGWRAVVDLMAKAGLRPYWLSGRVVDLATCGIETWPAHQHANWAFRR